MTDEDVPFVGEPAELRPERPTARAGRSARPGRRPKTPPESERRAHLPRKGLARRSRPSP